MKKVIVPIVLLVIIVFAAYMILFKKKEDSREKSQPIAVNAGDSLTGSVGKALQAYYNMKDAFTKSDTALVNTNAAALVVKLDSMKLEEIKADSAIIDLAAQLKQSMLTETKNIENASGIENKRKVFQTVSDGMFDLLRTISYNGSKVYQQYCPMAFNNSGAAWLSNSTEIVNPYFGEKMPHCGDVRDSVVIAR